MHRTELLDGVAEVPRDEWNALVGDGSPFLEWDWLASLEHARVVGPETGWQPRPLVVREGTRIVAACPLYVKAHREGEFVFDGSWADAAERAGLRYYPKLLVGVPFTPVTGARFLVAPGEDRDAWVRRLAETLREICLESGTSGVHVNFCRPDEAKSLEGTDFMLRVGIQYHWRNDGFTSFEGYLARLRSKRRNQIRRERRELQKAGVAVDALVGDAIPDELFAVMFRCYLATVENHYWGRQYLNSRFFELLRERFRHRLCFVVARQDGEVIGGTTNVVKDDALYGRYWGALRPVRYLHFDVCYYAAIDYCIQAGIERFEPGAGGDYKFLRGFDAQPTFSLHFLAEPRLARAVSDFLKAERCEAQRAIEHLQARSALKPAGSGAGPPREGTRRPPP
ncbi:MAG: GNAT family N-acetyltransferase [Myxococcota bacterium]